MTEKMLQMLLAAVAAFTALLAPTAAGAVTVPESTSTTAPSAVTPTTIVTPRPADPDAGFQPEDIIDWIKDNVVVVIVVVGLVLLVALWKYVSRPSKTKF